MLYLQRVGEVEPNIRYCAYNIGDESAIQDLMQMRREAGGGEMSSELDVRHWVKVFRIIPEVQYFEADFP